MKINTDGTLLGALAVHKSPRTILDIGTGTGVVALMLAQRYPDAVIEAVEIEKNAADTAARNFKGSVFAERLTLYHSSFQTHSADHRSKRYDLIVSNPPFFINSLKSNSAHKQTARHADSEFFLQLTQFAAHHLSEDGSLYLILPLDTATRIINMAASCSLYVQTDIRIKSFPHSEPHRQLLEFGRPANDTIKFDFEIYSEQNQYSQNFVNKLKDFFTIF